VPCQALGVVVKVKSTELPAVLFLEAGEILHPLGSPPGGVTVTGILAPFMEVIFTVIVEDWPAEIGLGLAEGLIAKSFTTKLAPIRPQPVAPEA
jgi:hypothetical protein